MVLNQFFFTRNKSNFHSKLDNEVAILNAQKGFYYGLDDIASIIWEYIGEEGKSLDEILNFLMAEFDVDEATCKTDTLEFLKSMKDEGLIEYSE